MTILVIGDANADLTATVDQFPAEGDDRVVGQLSWGSGGMGVNSATALALLGADVRLLARVGPDAAAATALAVARAAGVDLSAIQHDASTPTGLCYVAVSPGGERTFFSYRGANALLDEESGLAALPGARWVHVSAYALIDGPQRATSLALIEAAGAAGVPISLDLCLPYLREHPGEVRQLLARLAILFANEHEIALLGGAEPNALAQLVAHGQAVVVVKRGAQGCIVATSDSQYTSAAFVVAAVDTNGCGDAFVAAFLQSHRAGRSLTECARYGNAAGALNATRYGSATGLPTQADLAAFMEQAG